VLETNDNDDEMLQIKISFNRLSVS